MEQNVVLCGANSYDQKYYLNQEFSALPDAVKQELQIHVCLVYRRHRRHFDA